MSHFNSGGQKETNLVKGTTFDLVRVIKDRASRNITLLNFVSAITQALIDAGFLTSSTLPTSVSQVRKYELKTTNYGLLLTDSVIDVDTSAGDVNINLMTATTAFDATSSQGQFFTIKKKTTDLNKVIINASGSDLIDGEASAELIMGSGVVLPSLTIMSRGTIDWMII